MRPSSSKSQPPQQHHHQRRPESSRSNRSGGGHSQGQGSGYGHGQEQQQGPSHGNVASRSGSTSVLGRAQSRQSSRASFRAALAADAVVADHLSASLELSPQELCEDWGKEEGSHYAWQEVSGWELVRLAELVASSGERALANLGRYVSERARHLLPVAAGSVAAVREPEVVSAVLSLIGAVLVVYPDAAEELIASCGGARALGSLAASLLRHSESGHVSHGGGAGGTGAAGRAKSKEKGSVPDAVSGPDGDSAASDAAAAERKERRQVRATLSSASFSSRQEQDGSSLPVLPLPLPVPDVPIWYPGDAALASCIRLVYVLSVDPSAVNALFEAGVLSAVLPIMHSHLHSLAIQSLSINFLLNVAINPDARDTINKERGLSLVLWAMKHHPLNDVVQSSGARTLGVIGADPAVATVIGRERGLAVLLSALRNHMARFTVAADVTTCLAALVRAHQVNIGIFLSLAGVPSVRDVLEGPGGADASVATSCMTLLCNASGERAGADVMVAEGNKKKEPFFFFKKNKKRLPVICTLLIYAYLQKFHEIPVVWIACGGFSNQEK